MRGRPFLQMAGRGDLDRGGGSFMEPISCRKIGAWRTAAAGISNCAETKASSRLRPSSIDPSLIKPIEWMVGRGGAWASS